MSRPSPGDVLTICVLLVLALGAGVLGAEQDDRRNARHDRHRIHLLEEKVDALCTHGASSIVTRRVHGRYLPSTAAPTACAPLRP